MIINHGVRGSIPSPNYKTLAYGGNTPCVELKDSKYQLIFDCGSGFSKVDFSNNLQTILFIIISKSKKRHQLAARNLI